MSNAKLEPLSALDAAKSASRTHVAIEVLDGLCVVWIAARKGQSGALVTRVNELYGVSLPSNPRLATSRSGIDFLGTGPEQWLAIAPAADSLDLASVLAGQLHDLASVADQTGRANACPRFRRKSARYARQRAAHRLAPSRLSGWRRRHNPCRSHWRCHLETHWFQYVYFGLLTHIFRQLLALADGIGRRTWFIGLLRQTVCAVAQALTWKNLRLQRTLAPNGAAWHPVPRHNRLFEKIRQPWL